MYYELTDSTSAMNDPVGIDIEAYDENFQSGTINQDKFKVKVKDGQEPMTYYFYIRATAMGGAVYWT